MINWKVRLHNPAWWLGMVGIVMSPVLAYLGLAYSDLTTWGSLADVFVKFISNPYLIGTVVVAVLGAIGVTVDPTTKGLSDSARAMTYVQPSERPASYMTGNAEPINTKPAEEPKEEPAKEEVNNA